MKDEILVIPVGPIRHNIFRQKGELTQEYSLRAMFYLAEGKHVELCTDISYTERTPARIDKLSRIENRIVAVFKPRD